jgi:hypothetical protein
VSDRGRYNVLQMEPVNRIEYFVFASLILSMACATLGMNSVQRLNQLSPSMTADEIIDILGEPQSSEIASDNSA